MWGTLSLIVILTALLAFNIMQAALGESLWYAQVLQCLWIAYFTVIACLFLYREQAHAAKSGSLFRLHDRLLAESVGGAKNSPAITGGTLADEDKLL